MREKRGGRCPQRKGGHRVCFDLSDEDGTLCTTRRKGHSGCICQLLRGNHVHLLGAREETTKGQMWTEGRTAGGLPQDLPQGPGGWHRTEIRDKLSL